MFSISPAEILTIAVVALIVFGPRRMPELSRRAGRLLRELKETAQDLREGIEAEAGGDLGLADVRRELRATLDLTAPDPERGTRPGMEPDRGEPTR